VEHRQGLQDEVEGLVKLELVLLASSLRKGKGMEGEAWEAPSSKEEDEVEVV